MELDVSTTPSLDEHLAASRVLPKAPDQLARFLARLSEALTSVSSRRMEEALDEALVSASTFV
eukprot:CAMPEP_0183366062 /NCGR_PEP_ID=MMETSP0164_2-20130417/87206_1 /TAXON_ID=221442 /ORGANISM="Coccolithus pelagicus ssp braarudi, Strain PLY182g" /LENGTH=62 /DNA_ID=CAMNT_0025541723 /DNA_START=28 /DNA_END=212 /DNA_ORIENTATION=-